MEDNKSINSQNTNRNESRVLPLLIASIFCFVIACFIGYGTWTVFGTQARNKGVSAKLLEKLGLKTPRNQEDLTKLNSRENEKVIEPQNVNENRLDEIIKNLSDVVKVSGMEVTVGGDNTQRPENKFYVEDFFISETEVTNAQYLEFINETNYPKPSDWNKSEIPADKENFPVVWVSWDDANAFCKWLGEKYQVNVRLPNQAEWELAARGQERFLYPWGNDWNDEGVESSKKSSSNPVKSFPVNKSPFGAYDMVGNVWEWTSEEITRSEMESEVAKKATTKNERVFLVLGGSFIEDRKKLRNTFWAELKANTKAKSLGFRFVIVPNQSSN